VVVQQNANERFLVMAENKELTWGGHPGPGSELPEDATYFTLGCGNPNCPHSISFEATQPDANIIEEIIEEVSPQRITNQNFTRVKSPGLCAPDGADCPAGHKIDNAVTMLVGTGLLDNYLNS
jgi:hypothetical protein